MDGKSYSVYMPSDEELTVIESALSLLPPLHKTILQDRLLGIEILGRDPQYRFLRNPGNHIDLLFLYLNCDLSLLIYTDGGKTKALIGPTRGMSSYYPISQYEPDIYFK